jgi:dihydrofolate reductase
MDALVMGSKTYEKVLSFGWWPYGDKPVIVLSSRRLEISEELMASIEVLSAPPREIVRRLADRGLRHLPADIHLRHISTRAYPNGLVQSRYVIS